MLPEFFEFTLPTKLIYGIGIIGNLAETVNRFGKRNAILVTDKILVDAGPVDKVKKGFQNTNINIKCVFDEVPPNSTITAVQDCAALGIENKCDLIIAVGGGSVIDTAKVANLIMTKGGKVEDHMGAYLLESNEQLLPSIVIPTTAGTGSEVTKVAVIADPDNDVKLPFTEDQFLPELAVLDPELTVSMPAKLTACTGMDALVHAIEAYVDKECSPASDAFALHAMQLISDNILQACDKPEDLEARGAMLVGSFLAGVAFSHSMVGMVHGISHALGGVYHIPHGLANTLILPEVMEYNLEARVDRFAQIAMTLGVSFPQIINESQNLIKTGKLDLISKVVQKTDFETLKDFVDTSSHSIRNFAVKKLENLGFVDNWIKKQTALAGIENIRNLNRQLAYLTKIPLNLKDAGIEDNLAKLELLADTAMQDGSMLYNPIEPQRKDVIKIIQKVYHAKTKPLKVSKEELRSKAAKKADKKELTNVFDNTDMLYDVLTDFYNKLKAHPEIGSSLNSTNMCIQFRYKNPSAIITIDATGDEPMITNGEFPGTPEVTMTMDADFAHKFWHGKANLVTALTRRRVVAKGNVTKTLKLLPILKPAYQLYPDFLKEKGLEHLIIN